MVALGQLLPLPGEDTTWREGAAALVALAVTIHGHGVPTTAWAHPQQDREGILPCSGEILTKDPSIKDVELLE